MRQQAGQRSYLATGTLAREELITLVNGSVSFTAVKFPINPGQAGTFPVGSPEANNWTEWSCRFMEVEYVPTVSEFATQGQIGEVAVACDYNAANQTPTNMQSVEAMHFAGGGIPARGFKLVLLPKYLNKSDPKYIRDGPISSGVDIRLFDGGNLFFCTAGCTNTNQIGKLLVRYFFDVQLPTLDNPASGAQAPQQSSRTSLFLNSTAQTVTTGTAVNVWATGTVIAGSFDALGIGLPAAGVFTPPKGTYLVRACINANDNGSEFFNGSIVFLKNGSTVSTGGKAAFNTAGGNGATELMLVLETTLVASGSDTFAANLIFTGAFGTLTVAANSTIVWQLA